jgi:hypothetical protein
LAITPPPAGPREGILSPNIDPGEREKERERERMAFPPSLTSARPCSCWIYSLKIAFGLKILSLSDP